MKPATSLRQGHHLPTVRQGKRTENPVWAVDLDLKANITGHEAGMLGIGLKRST